MEEKKPCTFCGVVESVSDWARAPFSSDITAFQALLTLGLILIGVWMWQVILLTIHEEI